MVPTGEAARGDSQGAELLEVAVVGEYLGFANDTLEMVAPVFEGCLDGQEFFFEYIVVWFVRGERA